MWPSVAEVPAADLGDGGARFAPAIDAAERAERKAKWDKAVEASFGWAA